MLGVAPARLVGGDEPLVHLFERHDLCGFDRGQAAWNWRRCSRGSTASASSRRFSAFSSRARLSGMSLTEPIPIQAFLPLNVPRVDHDFDVALRTFEVEPVLVEVLAWFESLGRAGSIGAFIESVYNRQRLHSALAYRSPDVYETALGRFSGVTQEVSVNRELLPI